MFRPKRAAVLHPYGPRVLGVHCSNTANKQYTATDTAEQMNTIGQDGERPHRGEVRGVYPIGSNLPCAGCRCWMTHQSRPKAIP